MKEKKNNVTWYVYHVGSLTNLVISKLLNLSEAEACYPDCTCADGKRRNLWRMPDYEKITQLEKSVTDFDLLFSTFKQEGKDGDIKAFSFRKFKKREGSDLVKKAQTLRRRKQKAKVS